MIIAGYKLQPVSIYLDDTAKWIDRWGKASVYFFNQSIHDVLWVQGLHAEISGLKPAKPFLRDNPDGTEYIEQKTIGANISMYMCMNVMHSHPEVEHWLFMEDDCRFVEGWKEKLEQALIDVPPDFDYLFGGSCCTEGRPTTQIKGNVYEVKYPLCGHMTIIAKKALPVILSKQKNMCSPGDIEKFDHIFKYLKVYTILPRIAHQGVTQLPV